MVIWTIIGLLFFDIPAVADSDMPEVGICPVMHDSATLVSAEYSYTYKGEKYYFCCPRCMQEFKKNPEGYLFRIKEIRLEAYQFGFEPERIVVKRGDIVRIIATSRDVPHGIYIKEYGINVPVKKGEFKMIEFMAERAGEFEIRCSVCCGRGHGLMKGRLIVEE